MLKRVVEFDSLGDLSDPAVEREVQVPVLFCLGEKREDGSGLAFIIGIDSQGNRPPNRAPRV